MRWLRRLIAIVRGLVRRNGVANEIREEMRFHVDRRAEEYQRQGLGAAEAERAARRQFGNAAVHQDAGYDVRGAGVWDSVSQDVRYAARRLRAAPGFTVTAVLTLALGIGANSAIFSLANGLLARDVPGARLDRLAAVMKTDRRVPAPFSGLTNDERQILETAHLDGVAGFFTSDVLLAGVTVSDRTSVHAAELVSGLYFSGLGVAAVEGRTLEPADDRDVGGGTPVVIGARLKRQWFPRGETAVGRTLAVAGQPLTIVGVVPAEFKGTWLPTIMAVDLWIPAAAADRLRTVQGAPVSGPHRTFAVLAPGASRQVVDAAMQVAGRRFAADRPEQGIVLVEPARSILFDEFRRPGLAFAAGVVGLSALVFLIACANITNLHLARVLTRTSEMATRLALGASRARVFRLLLTETILVTAGAAVAAVVVTYLATASMALISLPPLEGQQIRFDPTPDWRVFAYALAVACTAALVVGVLPAWRATQADPVRGLAAGGGRSMESRRTTRARTALVAAQVAMSTVLLVAAALYLRSAIWAQHVDLGYDGSRLLSVSVDLRYSRLDESAGRPILQRMQTSVLAVPGIRDVFLTSGIAPSDSRRFTAVVVPEGRSSDPRGIGELAQSATIAPGTLRALGLSLMQGRDFNVADDVGAPRVAIVSRALAERCWPGGDPIGKRLQLERNGPMVEVIGVAPSLPTPLTPARVADAFVYLPIAQNYTPQPSLVAVADAEPARLVEPVRRAVEASYVGLVVIDAGAVSDRYAMLRAAMRLTAGVLGAFGLIGLAMSLIGLHGVMACFVNLRTREFGVRRALGASAAGIYRLVLRSAAAMVLLGIGVGVPAAWIASMLIRRLIFGVDAHDPVAFVAVPLLLIAVGLASSCVAARRAARVEPAEALRDL